jgi:uncharacterized protein
MKMTIDNVSSNPQLLTIVPIYAAIFGLMFVYLSVLVIKQRRANKVSLGDGDNPALRKAIAVHSNFSQYVPLALLLITFVELNHAPALLTHGLCASLLIGRVAHAYGLAQAVQIMKLRQIGVLLTFGVIIISALYLLASAI